MTTPYEIDRRLVSSYLVFIWILAFGLLILHSFFNIVVDAYSIGLVVILLILPFAPFLEKIRIGDNEFILNQRINKLETSIQKYSPNLKQRNTKKLSLPNPPYDRSTIREMTSYLMKLAEDDPVAAIARLRIEIENILRSTYQTTFRVGLEKVPYSNYRMVAELEKKGVIDKELLRISQDAIVVCNQVIHGGQITKMDAIRTISLGMRLISYLHGYHSGMRDAEKAIITALEELKTQS
jgi:hypothetical protein